MTEAAIDATALRVFIYDWLLLRGVPPRTTDIADQFSVSPADARQALADLKIGKTVLPHPRTGEIWMAGPFSAVETPYVVTGIRTRWWANCAWDMLGVAMIAHEPVRIDSRCTDCGEPLVVHATPAAPPAEEYVVHFLVPARRWYDDVGFT